LAAVIFARWREAARQAYLREGFEPGEATALADYNIAIANLYAAMGTALERNRIELSLVDVEPSK
jgi:hypothetical protein